ncbi:hypothetical protein BD324DRAFT_655995 [Kockovaella imperatae]|uniref:Adhesin domain-containing protein n=1 Tax=Kockovaella imperatae TaxID=4999 RepID=A0A1Y1UJD8_9TREE|nr:hypothetical protein BD324DRAFT_655995 [Kockovaella imperatae]ORX37614.1 hypothetical protein BD324DRAFT_655995 [Kockovaella imperatae]
MDPNHGQGPSRLDFNNLFGRLNPKSKDKDDNNNNTNNNTNTSTNANASSSGEGEGRVMTAGDVAPPYSPREEGSSAYPRDPGYLIYIPYSQLPRWAPGFNGANVGANNITNSGSDDLPPSIDHHDEESGGRRGGRESDPLLSHGKHKHRRRQKWRGIIRWMAVVFFIVLIIINVTRHRDPRRDDRNRGDGQPGQPDHPGQPNDPSQPSPPPPSQPSPPPDGPPHKGDEADPARFPGDGVAIECAYFDSSTVWRPYNDHNHDRDRDREEEAELSADLTYDRFSTDVTFTVPVRDDIFTRLTGPAGLGSVYVSTHDDGDKARITVESMIGVPQGSPLTESLAYRYLQASNICRMAKDEKNVGNLTIGEDFGIRDGVGIYTARPEKNPEHDDDNIRLSFRIHIFLPRSIAEVKLGHYDRVALEKLLRKFPNLTVRKSLTRTWLEIISSVLMGKTGPQVLAGLLATKPSLHIDTPIGSTSVGDIHTSPLSHFGVHSSVGSVGMKNISAENIIIGGSGGSVNGHVSISDSIDVRLSTGSIDLTLALAKDALKETPYSVKLKSSTGSVDLKHREWEDPTRRLQEDVSTSMGSIGGEHSTHSFTIPVHSNPLFEGAFSFLTQLGSIRVEGEDTKVKDPLGRGRRREINIDRVEGRFPRVFNGRAAWTGGEPIEYKPGDGWMNLKADTGSINVTL